MDICMYRTTLINWTTIINSKLHESLNDVERGSLCPTLIHGPFNAFRRSTSAHFLIPSVITHPLFTLLPLRSRSSFAPYLIVYIWGYVYSEKFCVEVNGKFVFIVFEWKFCCNFQYKNFCCSERIILGYLMVFVLILFIYCVFILLFNCVKWKILC